MQITKSWVKNNRKTLITLIVFLGLFIFSVIIDLQKSHKNDTPKMVSYPDVTATYKNNDHEVYLNARATSTKKLIKKPVPKNKLIIPVLMYHHVANLNKEVLKTDPGRYNLTVGVDSFEQQLKKIKNEGYETITSQDLDKYINQKVALPKKPIMLTFDDGYLDNYVNAFYLLKKYQMKGEFAIISGVIGAPVYMRWEQLEQMRDAGMEIASHTVNHCYLAQSKKDEQTGKYVFIDSVINDKPNQLCPGFTKAISLNTGQIYGELVKSKNDLEKKLGIKILSLYYPYGHYNQQVINIAKKVGYEFGWTTKTQVDYGMNIEEPFELKRTRATAGQEFDAKAFLREISN